MTIFADDQVVVAQYEEDLNYILRELENEYEETGLNIDLYCLELSYGQLKDLKTEENFKIKLNQTRSCIKLCAMEQSCNTKDVNNHIL